MDVSAVNNSPKAQDNSRAESVRRENKAAESRADSSDNDKKQEVKVKEREALAVA